jgi:hypothetical protein
MHPKKWVGKKTRPRPNNAEQATCTAFGLLDGGGWGECEEGGGWGDVRRVHIHTGTRTGKLDALIIQASQEHNQSLESAAQHVVTGTRMDAQAAGQAGEPAELKGC